MKTVIVLFVLQIAITIAVGIFFGAIKSMITYFVLGTIVVSIAAILRKQKNTVHGRG